MDVIKEPRAEAPYYQRKNQKMGIIDLCVAFARVKRMGFITDDQCGSWGTGEQSWSYPP
jgi:hypothetical protein